MRTTATPREVGRRPELPAFPLPQNVHSNPLLRVRWLKKPPVHRAGGGLSHAPGPRRGDPQAGRAGPPCRHLAAAPPGSACSGGRAVCPVSRRKVTGLQGSQVLARLSEGLGGHERREGVGLRKVGRPQAPREPFEKAPCGPGQQVARLSPRTRATRHAPWCLSLCGSRVSCRLCFCLSCGRGAPCTSWGRRDMPSVRTLVSSRPFRLLQLTERLSPVAQRPWAQRHARPLLHLEWEAGQRATKPWGRRGE